MDVFRIAKFLRKHRKKILLINHIAMILHLMNLVYVIFNGKFEMYPLYYIWMFIFQFAMLFIIQIQLSEKLNN